MNIGDVVILTPIHQVDWSGRQPECFIVTINGVYTAPFQVPNTETEILGLVGVDNQQRTFKFYFKSGNWYMYNSTPLCVYNKPYYNNMYGVRWAKNTDIVRITMTTLDNSQKPYRREILMKRSKWSEILGILNREVEATTSFSGDPSRGNMPKCIARTLRKEARRRFLGLDHKDIFKSIVY